MAGLIEELKRRNVFKVSAAYVVLAWLLAQAADLAAETFEAPGWVMKMLVTLLALAFPLVLFFAWAYELTPEGLKKEKDVDRSQSITPQTSRKLDFVIIGLMAVALVYFIWESRYAPTKGSESIVPASAEETPTGVGEQLTLTPPEKSIAVLPFVNMSEDAGNESFSDGISEEILNALAKVKELKVAGRTSSFAFKGQNQDLRQIGETLGVAHILEGSVRKAGDKVRITAQLIQVKDGFHLWSESYDRELTDVFAIQDEIAAAILLQLKAQLLAGDNEVVEANRTSSEAYDSYLLARQRIYERKQLSIESAKDLLDRVIELDPDYAPAYAQRGITAVLLTEQNYGKTPQEEGLTQAKRDIDQALQLNPDLAEGWAALGMYHLQRPGAQDEAIDALEKARAINPSLIDASNWLGIAYKAAGRLGDSLRVLDDMIERDPLYPPAIGNAVTAFGNRGMSDQAAALLAHAKAYMPGDPLILYGEALGHFLRGDIALGLPLVERAMAQQPGNAHLRFTWSTGLYQSHQYERLASEGYPAFQVFALTHLQRTEEAGILAQRLAAQGDVGSLLGFLNVSGKSQDVVRYVEEHWGDLDRLEADFPATGLTGYPLMTDVAYAYSRTGNQQRFDDAMRRIRRAHDEQRSAGADNYIFYILEASYYALAGDRERAIDFFERAIDRGYITSTRPGDDQPYLKSLDGEPRFEAARLRMIEHLNRERTQLGLEPAST
ncbi:MAG TPA: hypothetical protein VI566_00040 [Xanthomonadales bacterium]|nr:hypothetical protein [Xanthomonadales bacterium]